MLKFNPIKSPKNVRVVFAEDSEYEAEPMKIGLRRLLGIQEKNLHHFQELDEASLFFDKMDKKMPTVAILDNNTIRSSWKGHELAKSLLRRQEEFPNLMVVTVSSSDMGLALEHDGIVVDQLHKAGGEFWGKHSEAYVMLMWLGECLRTGQMTPRKEWLEKFGMESRYRELTEDHPPEDWAIFSLVDALEFAEKKGEQEVVRVMKDHHLEEGDFFNVDPYEIFARLGFPKSGIEGGSSLAGRK